jgi:hypothetical protein
MQNAPKMSQHGKKFNLCTLLYVGITERLRASFTDSGVV